MLVHYVEFDMPGAFMPETETRKVKDRIPANIVNIPKYTYAIQYFDKEEARHGKETLTGKPKSRSKRILFGKEYTLEEIEKMGIGKHTPLYFNASQYKVAKCIAGNWQPIEGAILLPDYKSLKKLNEPI